MRTRRGTKAGQVQAACNFADKLKALNSQAPYETTCNIWTLEPDQFTLNPIHQMTELNTWRMECRCLPGQSKRLLAGLD